MFFFYVEDICCSDARNYIKHYNLSAELLQHFEVLNQILEKDTLFKVL